MRTLFTLLTAALVACADASPEPADAGALEGDAGVRVEAGVADSGQPFDGGALDTGTVAADAAAEDTGQAEPDAGELMDAAGNRDASPGSDAAPSADAGAPEDAGSPCPPGHELDDEGACSVCAHGHFDHDEDARTPCQECTECTSAQVSAGRCSPTSEPVCAPCAANPIGLAPRVPNPPPENGCGAADPTCDHPIDLLVLYTDSMLTLIGGDVANFEAMTHYWVNLANQGMALSMLPPNMRYRIAGMARLPYAERDNLKSDLVWLKNSPFYQELRRSFAADMAVVFSGTQGFGGYAYSSQGRGANLDDRGIAMIDGHYFTTQFATCANAYLTPAHELGHLLGCNHLGSSMIGASGSNYGYHNQEVHLRRNEAFGLPVSQHNQKLYTLMSYAVYKNERNRTTPCLDCKQLPLYSSTDLWWFFAQHDPLYGSCLLVDEDNPEALQLHCGGDDAWRLVDGEWEPHPDALVTLSAEQLLARALPMGMDRPSYEDPDNPGQVIQREYSARNRDEVALNWFDRANNERPLAAANTCAADCQAQNRIRCAIGRATCGECLPDHYDHAGQCLPRVAAQRGAPLHDGVYGPSGVGTQPGQDPVVITMNLDQTRDLVAVDLFFATQNGEGQRDFGWASFGPNVWSANPAPPHAFELIALHANGQETPLATQLTPGVLLQHVAPQDDHSLTYRWTTQEPVTDVRAVRLVIQSPPPEPGDDPYGLTVDEVRLFGLTAP